MTASGDRIGIRPGTGLVPPVLDRRTADDVYAACLAAARETLPDWAIGFGDDPSYFDRSDVGLVLFKLFGELFHKLVTPLNGVPVKYLMAFWDFMGITLRAPEAAEAPVVFTTNGRAAIVLPARTRIGASTIPGLVFETRRALKVLPMTIDAAFGVQPDADAYVDLSSRIGRPGPAFDPFGSDASHTHFVHRLSLCDAGFVARGVTGTLTITFEGANLYGQYFQCWTNGAGQSLRPDIQGGYDTLTFTFAVLPDLPTATVDGVAGPWLAVAPTPDTKIVAFQATALPSLYAVTLALALSAAPEATMANATPVDLKRGGRPFGATPMLEDAFYIASDAIFARPEAQVTLRFGVQPAVAATAVTLAWEFWDGRVWSPLAVRDGTDAFRRSGDVTFTCPAIPPTLLNGRKSRWIRARIAAGGYGHAAGVLVTEPAAAIVDDVLAPYVADRRGAVAALAKRGLNFGFAYDPASFAPPFIAALTLGCRIVKRPDHLVSQNGFSIRRLETRPFVPPSEGVPTLYLGLASTAYDSEIAGGPMTVLFALGSDARGQTPDSAARPSLDYLGRQGWARLDATEASHVLAEDGIAGFTAPSDFPEQTLFGRSCRWLRLRQPARDDGTWRLAGIHLNAASARDAIHHESVILGSSTGGPAQTFDFPQKPILAGQVVQVLEPAPADATDASTPEDLDASLPAILQGDAPTEIWVTWTEVPNFDFSDPASRHYLLDHSTGQLSFGDGLRGLAPIRGRRNIRALHYRSGGGSGGNVGIGVLDTPRKAVPGLASVTNPSAAAGGMGADRAADLLSRAPGEMKSQGFAVSREDFASVAVTASRDVVRAICVEDDSGEIRVAILPDGAEPLPMPGPSLVTAVQSVVRARALPLLASRIVVGGPRYETIPVAVLVRLAPTTARAVLAPTLSDAFAAYLHPLTGGDANQGWAFGARLESSALAIALAAVPGVAAILSVAVGAPASGAVTLAADGLPCPGPMTIRYVDADTL